MLDGALGAGRLGARLRLADVGVGLRLVLADEPAAAGLLCVGDAGEAEA